MPAPSPVLGSLPLAPRCSRLRSTVSALATVSWLGSPDRSATKPTPHASCSKLLSYSPPVLAAAAGAIQTPVVRSEIAFSHAVGTTLALPRTPLTAVWLPELVLVGYTQITPPGQSSPPDVV